MILAIETATSVLSVALVSDSGLQFSVTVNRNNLHDELLVPLIDTMMKNGHWSLSDVRAVAVSAGPGSFTGLRIGMSAGKGLALALGIPLVAVPTFDAMAWRVSFRYQSSAPFLFGPVFDAKRNDVYAALYLIEPGLFRIRSAACAANAEEIPGMFPAGTWIAGTGTAKLETLPGSSFRVIPESELICHAESIGFLAGEMYKRGETADLDSCEPLYIRDFKTTMPLKTGKE